MQRVKLKNLSEGKKQVLIDHSILLLMHSLILKEMFADFVAMAGSEIVFL